MCIYAMAQTYTGREGEVMYMQMHKQYTTCELYLPDKRMNVKQEMYDVEKENAGVRVSG